MILTLNVLLLFSAVGIALLGGIVIEHYVRLKSGYYNEETILLYLFCFNPVIRNSKYDKKSAEL